MSYSAHPDKICLPPRFTGTPIEDLLLFHNESKRMPSSFTKPELILSLCMDQRIALHLPKGFAFSLCTPGSRLQGLEFAVSYAIAMAGVRALAIIGHTDCAMTKVQDLKERFVKQLDDWHDQWDAQDALKHFEQWAPVFYIRDMKEHIRSQVEWISKIFPDLLVAPLIYHVEDHRIVLLEDNETSP